MPWSKIFSPEWLFRAAAIGLLLANLYLNSHYINKDEYSADKQEWSRSLTKLNEAVIDLKFALAANAEQRSTISDHENRIRSLEKIAHPKNSEKP